MSSLTRCPFFWIHHHPTNISDIWRSWRFWRCCVTRLRSWKMPQVRLGQVLLCLNQFCSMFQRVAALQSATFTHRCLCSDSSHLKKRLWMGMGIYRGIEKFWTERSTMRGRSLLIKEKNLCFWLTDWYPRAHQDNLTEGDLEVFMGRKCVFFQVW